MYLDSCVPDLVAPSLPIMPAAIPFAHWRAGAEGRIWCQAEQGTAHHGTLHWHHPGNKQEVLEVVLGIPVFSSISLNQSIKANQNPVSTHRCSTKDPGQQPFAFNVGLGEVIVGTSHYTTCFAAPAMPCRLGCGLPDHVTGRGVPPHRAWRQGIRCRRVWLHWCDWMYLMRWQVSGVGHHTQCNAHLRD